MSWRAEREDFENITHLIQRQILKRRYAEGKQNKLYKNPPKFNQPVVRCINLTSKDTENVILFKRKN
jgi:hypothetical protein